MSASDEFPPGTGRPWLRALRRRQALVTALLLIAIFAATSRLAREHVRLRVDVSEDRLAEWSPATDTILTRLDEPVLIEAFFTRDLKHGVMQIAAGRLIDQLDELQMRSGGRVRVLYTDPSRVFHEMETARAFFRRHRLPIVDVTNKPIEASAAEVVGRLSHRIGRENLPGQEL